MSHFCITLMLATVALLQTELPVVATRCDVARTGHRGDDWLLYMSASTRNLTPDEVMTTGLADSLTTTDSGIACDPAVYYYDARLTNFTYLYDVAQLGNIRLQPPKHLTMLNVTCKLQTDIRFQPTEYTSLQSLGYRCMMGNIPPGFVRGLENLHILDLSDNNLTTLPSVVFQELPSLIILMLNNNPFVHFPSNLFCNLPWLYSLNMVNSFSRFPRMLFGNSTESCDLTYIALVRLNQNRFEFLPENAFYRLRSLNDELLMCDSDIKAISPSAFAGLNRILYVAMENNGIEEIPQGLLRPMRYLRDFFVSGNNITSLNMSMFSPNRDIHSLDMSHNQIKHIYGSFNADGHQMVFINLSHNSLEMIEKSTFSYQSVLRTLLLSNNQIRTVHHMAFRGLGELIELDLSHNQLTELSAGIFFNLNKLVRLKLHHNSLVSFLEPVFTKLPCLQILNLRHNQLTDFNFFTLLYSNLPDLEYLDLGENTISQFGNESHPSLEVNKIENLFLDNNNISSLPPKIFRNFYRLRNVTLHRNQLVTMNPDIFNCRTVALRLVSLHGNPWSCDCGNARLQAWLEKHENIIPDLQNLTCTYDNNVRRVPLLQSAFTDSCKPREIPQVGRSEEEMDQEIRCLRLQLQKALMEKDNLTMMLNDLQIN